LKPRSACCFSQISRYDNRFPIQIQGKYGRRNSPAPKTGQDERSGVVTGQYTAV